MPFKFFNKELSHVVGREPLTKREEARGPEHLPSALGQHPKERGKKEKKGKVKELCVRRVGRPNLLAACRDCPCGKFLPGCIPKE